MEQKRLDLIITYDDGVLPDINRDSNAIRNLNDWLEPLIEEISADKHTAYLHIAKSGVQSLSFSIGISEDLLIRIENELSKYRYRFTGINPDSK